MSNDVGKNLTVPKPNLSISATFESAPRTKPYANEQLILGQERGMSGSYNCTKDEDERYDCEIGLSIESRSS